MIDRTPDEIIGPISDPYFHRWHLIPQNDEHNVYLHRIFRPDNQRDLHDHPWPNITFVLRGWFKEEVVAVAPNAIGALYRRNCNVDVITTRRALDRHRIIAVSTDEQCWSLFITGKKVREWGFWVDDVFVPHTEYGKEA